jgi:hypothetical protein
MPSVCIRTILFTLSGQSPSQNKYIEIYILWLSQLIKSESLKSSDALELLADEQTVQQLQQTTFYQLCNSLQCKLKLYKLPQPSTLTEGCMWKYVPLEYTQDIFFYCDIDILIIKPIHILTNTMKDNTIYTHIEGSLFHKEFGQNYSIDFPQDILMTLPSDSPGYSAGKFFIYGKELRNRFFQYIQTLHSLRKMDYPMLEQPFYNRAIYDLKSTIQLNTSLLSDTNICRNNTNYQKENTILFD